MAVSLSWRSFGPCTAHTITPRQRKADDTIKLKVLQGSGVSNGRILTQNRISHLRKKMVHLSNSKYGFPNTFFSSSSSQSRAPCEPTLCSTSFLHARRCQIPQSIAGQTTPAFPQPAALITVPRKPLLATTRLRSPLRRLSRVYHAAKES